MAEVRLIQIAISPGKDGQFDWLIGLTKAGVVYEYDYHRDEWVAMSMRARGDDGEGGGCA